MKNHLRMTVLWLVFLALTPAFASAHAESMNAKMLNNLSRCSFVFVNASTGANRNFSDKRTAAVGMVRELLDAGYEPCFAAGVAANLICEGSFGLFENITGYTQTRLTQVYPNLKTCAESGKDHQNYIAHMKGFTDYDRCGHDHSEYDAYYRKHIYDDGVSLSAVYDMLKRYQAEDWHAKFGLGSLQWTGSRTLTLAEHYLAEANGADTITYDQCVAAESKCMLYELSHTHRSAYTGWKNANSSESPQAAYDAGYRVCYYYEVPANRAQTSEVRGNYARQIYEAMVDGLEEEKGQAPEVTNLRVSDITPLGYTLTCTVTDDGEVPVVAFPTWIVGEEEMNVPYESMVFDGTATVYVLTEDFDGRTGCSYRTEIVAWDSDGNRSAEGIGIEVSVPTIESYLKRLNGLVLPKDTKEIGEGAFAGTDAEYVIVPDGCEIIGARAFADCPNLKYVLVPEETWIMADAFEGCEAVIVRR